MTFKSVVALGVLFITQFIFSCNPCDCNSGTYEVRFEPMEVTAYNTSGFSTQLVTDTISRTALGLFIVIDATQKRISNNVASFGSFGFSSALACDCRDNDYIYVDQVTDMKIKVRDVDTGVETLITDHFGFPGYGGANITSLENYFTNMEPWGFRIQLDLVNEDDIPDASIFILEAYLNSGDVMIAETQQINFK